MITQDVFGKYLSSLLAGRRSECLDIVKRLLDEGCPVRSIYADIIQKSLYEVGTLWEMNRISVADEHLATAASEMILTMIYPHVFSGERCGKKAVVSCVANEYHQVGGKMIADTFEMNGWDGYFLGANTPVSDLLTFIEDTEPDYVGLSLAVYFNLPRLLACMDEVSARFPDMKIIVGGQAFRWGGTDVIDQYPSACYIDSMDRLETFISEA